MMTIKEYSEKMNIKVARIYYLIKIGDPSINYIKVGKVYLIKE